MLTVAGAGMAGLVAAARARELGLRPLVLERERRPGGSLALSSGVIWRHRDAAAFHRECPHGNPVLQTAVVERLDDALAWLCRRGAVATAGTGNPRTVGSRFDPRQLVRALAQGLELRVGEPLTAIDGSTVLACGGYAVQLARERGLLLRAAPGGNGDGIALGRVRGGAARGDPAGFYGRALPAPPAVVEPDAFVRAAQLYGRFAHVVDVAGRPVGPPEPAWHEVDIAQALAALPGGEGWYVVDGAGLRETVRERSVGEMVGVAAQLGGEVRRAETPDGLGLGALASPRLAAPPFVAVRVKVGVTHTYAGLAVDVQARVLDAAGRPLEGLWACGADAGGIFDGGYASGLAAALVLGLAAAESAAR
jgi:hypothetical protein